MKASEVESSATIPQCVWHPRTSSLLFQQNRTTRFQFKNKHTVKSSQLDGGDVLGLVWRGIIRSDERRTMQIGPIIQCSTTILVRDSLCYRTESPHRICITDCDLFDSARCTAVRSSSRTTRVLFRAVQRGPLQYRPLAPPSISRRSTVWILKWW